MTMPRCLRKMLVICMLTAIWTGTHPALTGCSSVSKKDGALATEVAKHEMRRRGWKRVEVYRCVPRDNVWVVTLGTRGYRRATDLAWVTVSPAGSVVDVVVSDQ
jgi:hypothetical protein